MSLSCRNHQQYTAAAVSSTSRSRTSCKATTSRRQVIGSLVTVPVLLNAGAVFAEDAPAAGQLGGNCPTCLGPVDGTLGSCAGLDPCSSSYDDRPPYFVAPWQYDGSTAAALQALVDTLEELGATVQQRRSDYVYATWSLAGPAAGGLVDMEFLFAQNDNTVAVRAAPQQQPSSSSSSSGGDSGSGLLPVGGGSNALKATLLSLFGSRPSQLLETVRVRLGWEEVPILRNRRRAFLFGESPFDDFGPVPPQGLDYTKDLLGDF